MRLHDSSLVLVFSVLAGCSASRLADPCAGGRCGSSAQALSAVDELISATNCAVRATHLVSCVIPSQTLSFTQFETAVPLRTTVASQRSGNCSTSYPLQVSLTPDHDPATSFAYIAGGQIQLKRQDHGPIAQLTVADSSPWTKSAAFDASCAISLAFTPNQPDVDSAADAKAIIAQLTSDVAAKQTARDNAKALDLYHKAFAFLNAVAQNFLGQLSNDQMQELRAAALDAQDSLTLLITSCSNLTQDQRAVLLRLDLGLAALGSPQDWQNADGGTKSIGDFLSPADQQVLQQIAQLDSADGGAPDYDAQYLAAETAYETAVHKLQLAQQQLAAWLS
ncbi:MAG TPA: hypothetical protein VHB97_19365 [Polyangia bacterium]|nr:hypothetical protein [Polyangia bacterium]